LGGDGSGKGSPKVREKNEMKKHQGKCSFLFGKFGLSGKATGRDTQAVKRVQMRKNRLKRKHLKRYKKVNRWGNKPSREMPASIVQIEKTGQKKPCTKADKVASHGKSGGERKSGGRKRD